jgi:hypothetical protein
MPLWGWLVIGLVLALVVLSALVQRARQRRRPVDPALVVRDVAEQRVDPEAVRRANERRFDDPGW